MSSGNFQEIRTTWKIPDMVVILRGIIDVDVCDSIVLAV